MSRRVHLRVLRASQVLVNTMQQNQFCLSRALYSVSSPLLLALLFFSFLPELASGNGPSSVRSMAEFSSMRPCAQNCVQGNNDFSNSMGCDSNNDYCYCREDLRPTASKILSGCVNSACATNSLDMSWAFRVYSDYCSFQGDAVNVSPSTCKQP